MRLFRVHPIAQPSSLTSLLTCSGWIHSMNAVTTDKGPMTTKETDTQLLIILLSVISSISATLLIVLVIVCIRCRLMRMTVSDHVYSEPSPALQAHYDYISSLETEKPHPQLNDEYFEVADALPFNLRDTPASPAYAEVDQFIDFKKGQWSSVDSSEWADCQSQRSNLDTTGDDCAIKPTEEIKLKQINIGTKKGPVEKLKLEKFNRSPKHKHMGKIPNTSEPKVFIVNLEKNRHDYDTCDDSAYEQIDIQPNGDSNMVVFSDSKYNSKRHQDERQDRKSQSAVKSSPRHGGNQKRPSHPHMSRVDQIKEGLLSKHTDQKDISKRKEKDVTNRKEASPRKDVTAKKKDFGGKRYMPVKTDKSLPNPNDSKFVSKNKTTTLVDSPSNKNCDSSNSNDTNNSKSTPYLKERLQTSGIVRNGIQKFEQN